MSEYRCLDEIVVQINDKITFGKDRSKAYIGLEHIESNGSFIKGYLDADESISTNSIFCKGDVLFGKLRPNLRKCVLAPFDGYCSTDILVLRSNKRACDRYVGRIFQTELVGAFAENTAIGTKMPRTSWNQLKALKVFCPELPSQEIIANILDSLDAAIQKTEAIIEKLKQIKQGLLHDLLTRGIDANGELRPPPELAPQLYKESPLGLIPVGWELSSIDSISTIVTSGSRSWAPFYSDSGAFFVRIGNLTRDHINLRFDSVIFVNPPKNADGQRTKLEAGDLLISITADLGIVGVVPCNFGEAYINQHIAMVRLDQEQVNCRFVGHFLAGGRIQKIISQLNDSGAKAGLNLPTIRQLMMLIPPKSEQETVALRLDTVDDRIQLAKTELEKLKRQKVGLMNDLLTGQVRVTPLLEKHDGPHNPALARESQP